MQILISNLLEKLIYSFGNIKRVYVAAKHLMKIYPIKEAQL